MPLYAVTATGEPVAGLTADEFGVTLDGRAVDQFELTLPPGQDSSQKVSVVIVVKVDPYFPTPDYSGFVSQTGIGDHVSVVKYWGDFERPRFGGMSILPFTELDDGRRSERVINFIRREAPFGQLGTTQIPVRRIDGGAVRVRNRGGDVARRAQSYSDGGLLRRPQHQLERRSFPRELERHRYFRPESS
jgi:hypothetical protein